jgi:flagellar operon protein
MEQINRFSSIEQVTGQYLNRYPDSPKAKSAEGYTGASFDEILQLKFSRHASMRLNDRNIDLSAEQMERLSNGAAQAEEKGIKESLIMVDSLAFIVNIPNGTVVTAIDQNENGTGSHIFTNIDGAVIA